MHSVDLLIDANEPEIEIALIFTFDLGLIFYPFINQNIFSYLGERDAGGVNPSATVALIDMPVGITADQFALAVAGRANILGSLRAWMCVFEPYPVSIEIKPAISELV
ncbi:hypothetical protein GH140_01880, partial [bacterium]|nr:hypothetical protein [bacterium]